MGPLGPKENKTVYVNDGKYGIRIYYHLTDENLSFVNNLHVQLTKCTGCPIASIIVPLVIYSCSNLNAVLSNSIAVGTIWFPVGIVEGISIPLSGLHT